MEIQTVHVNTSFAKCFVIKIQQQQHKWGDGCSYHLRGLRSPLWSLRGTPGQPAQALREPPGRSQTARAPRRSESELSTWPGSGLGWTVLVSVLCPWSPCLSLQSHLLCQYLHKKHNICSFISSWVIKVFLVNVLLQYPAVQSKSCFDSMKWIISSVLL